MRFLRVLSAKTTMVEQSFGDTASLTIFLDAMVEENNLCMSSFAASASHDPSAPFGNSVVLRFYDCCSGVFERV